MADFRKWFLVLAAVALLVGTANAQGFQCTANAGVTPLVRAEGIAELTGDLVLNCNGMAPANGIIANIRIFLNTNVTSRLYEEDLAAPNEALLMIDDPAPGDQVYWGVNGVWTPASNLPNVFQGITSGVNTIDWLGIPLVAAGSASVAQVNRIYRFTNIRANASQLGVASGLVPQPIQAFISVSGATAVPVNNPTQVIGFVQKGLIFSVGDALGLKQCTPDEEDAVANPDDPLVLEFKEGFANSFKEQGDDSQDEPGTVYNTESGLHPDAVVLSGSLPSDLGVADQGTRLWALFTNLPDGVDLNVPEQVTTASGLVVCVVSDPDDDGSGGDPDCGDGDVTLSSSGGATAVVYEVVTAGPVSIATNDTVEIPVTIVYTDIPPDLTTGDGAMVQGNFAPVSDVTGPSDEAPVPRFLNVASEEEAFTLTACRTVLLFPYVTNAAMFDTGIAISNTSMDPFDTVNQQGPCEINYYGNIPATGAPAPAAVTTPSVEAGEQLAFIVSSGGGVVGTDKSCAACATPGFHGYVIAICDFQYAHGFAFVSDLGAAKLAEGYLALIIPDRSSRGAAAFSMDASENDGEQLVH
jgi:hypothetical protein